MSSMKRFQITLMIICTTACTQNGSTVVVKGTDSAVQEDVDTGSSTASGIPTQPEYTTWSGSRNITFPDLCVFTIEETGQRLVDPSHELIEKMQTDCPQCQVYQIENSPESVDCGELGALPTGGTRYRILSFQEQYSDGTLNVTDGNVDLWYAIEPDWNLDFITEATFNMDTTAIHQWNYEATNNFQAFQYWETSTFTLSEEPLR